jgi:hypothetical protein
MKYVKSENISLKDREGLKIYHTSYTLIEIFEITSTPSD